MAKQISRKSILLSALLVLAFALTAQYSFSQDADKTDVTTKSQDEEAVREEASSDEADTMKLLSDSLPSHTQYCQGKYRKKGIGGEEIITVECPYVKDTCSCEVVKGSLTERVNCGGNTKNASKGSEFIECNSMILRN